MVVNSPKNNYSYLKARGLILVFCLIIPIFAVISYALESSDDQTLFSPSLSEKFSNIAYEISQNSDISDRQAQQAVIFFLAAKELDPKAKDIIPQIIGLLQKTDDGQKNELIYKLIAEYVDDSADLEVTANAINLLLRQLDSREEREKLYSMLLRTVGQRNDFLASDLAASLGSLMAEKANTQNAANYFIQAYHKNKYNSLAFAKLNELVPEQITDAMYLENLRLSLAKNPLDLPVAVAFARYADQLGLYKVSSDAYGYCSGLYEYLNPSASLPASISIPWSLANYNIDRDLYKCHQISQKIKDAGGFDLMLEAIAAAASKKMNNSEKADLIIDEAEDKALKLAASGKIEIKQIAWFYLFSAEDSQKALDWANKAYAQNPDDSTAAAILAYALIENGQVELAESIIDKYDDTQIANLATAEILITKNQNEEAVKTLKTAIDMDPTSLEAQRAGEKLKKLNAEYVGKNNSDLILKELKESLTLDVVPEFRAPEKMVNIDLKVRGSKFAYGRDFRTTLVITNKSTEPILIDDGGMLKGRLRVDAVVTGDIKATIPNLLTMKIRPSSTIDPQQSLIIGLKLDRGKLSKILENHPQASIDIEFIAYIDPVVMADGKVQNSISSIAPARVEVSRPAKVLTQKFLQNRLDSLVHGQQGQKIEIANLLVGLLKEQNAMANREPLYRFMYADWMPELLKSAVIRSIDDYDWTVKAHTTCSILNLPLEFDMVDVIAYNINDTHWPLRLISLYLLAKNHNNGFQSVLDWAAQYDENEFVRDMAIALGGKTPKPKTEEPKSQNTAAVNEQILINTPPLL